MRVRLVLVTPRCALPKSFRSFLSRARILQNGMPLPADKKLLWEAYERKDEPGIWAVEAIGPDGEIYLVKFYETWKSRELAEEYAGFKNLQIQR